MATDERDEVRALLGRISGAWQQGHWQELGEYFHENMVIRGPELQEMGSKGRDASVASYREFMSQAAVHELKESDPKIDVWGNTAVASYGWEIKYEMGGLTHHEFGRDLFVFSRESGKWLAVWRAVFFSAQA